MRLSIFAAAVALAGLASPAFADPPGNNGGGNGGCGVGQQTNGCGGQGGAGGNGGNGGNSTSTANAGALVVNDSFNTTVRNSIDDHSIRNTNSNANLSTNVNSNTAFGGAGGKGVGVGVGLGGSAGASASQDQTQAQSQTQSLTNTGGNSSNTVTGGAQSNSNSAVGSGNTTTFSDNSVYEAQKRNPVSSAYAAPLSIGSGVCMYTPVSASGQGITIGLSGSVAKRDDECERRSTADMFARVGMTYEACQIMAQAPHARAVGITCARPVAAQTLLPPPPAIPPKVPATMLPIPNPVPVNDGERG